MVDVSEMRQLIVPKAYNAKRLYLFVSPSPHQFHDCQLESVHIQHHDLDSALIHLNQGGPAPDVIIFQNPTNDDKSLIAFSGKRNIPTILYSNRFIPILRDVALKFQMDDYLCGPINDNFVSHVDFLRDLKTLRNSKEVLHVASKHEESPKVKIWGMKRVFDVIISACALFILSPVMLLIALIIKLESKGSIFYIAKRSGSCYNVFSFYKFRTMREGAANELRDLARSNQYSGDGKEAVFFKIKNDPRVTRFGEFLRKTSMDELPQLINVLKGDMSLVGNRPLPLYEAEKLTRDNIAWRFLAPAGITGLWQVTKRGKENMSPEERIQLDMEYAMRNSFLFDLKILFMTIPALLQKERV
jgi:lipopolysaccharide/colanic/teichoic acid biosynthesis glycosyltransferase